MASRETIEYWWQSIRHRPLSRPQRTVGPNDNNPPKMRFKKFMKLTDYTYACNDFNKLKGPETEVMQICWNLLGKLREIPSSELIFGVFYLFGTTVQWPQLSSLRMIYRYGAPSVLKESKQWHLLLLTTQMHIVLFSDKLLWEKTVHYKASLQFFCDFPNPEKYGNKYFS